MPAETSLWPRQWAGRRAIRIDGSLLLVAPPRLSVAPESAASDCYSEPLPSPNRELQGASRDDVLTYLGIDGVEPFDDERRAAASEAVASFFEVVRELKLLSKAEDDDRLPFGVAYFSLVRKWVEGQLDAPVAQSTPLEGARDLLAGSLRTLGRTRQWEEALRKFLAKT